MKKGNKMPTPEPQQSVAELLEQILAVANQQLAVAQQTLTAVQASNGTLTQLLDVSQQSLASSIRIEKLLGGGTDVSIPAMLKIIYEKVLKSA